MYTNWRDSLPALPPPTASHKATSSASSTTSSVLTTDSILKFDDHPQPQPEYKHTTSLPWILHHILECELSSELPLRIMYSFNAGQKLPTLKEVHKWWAYDPKGKMIIEFLSSLPSTDVPPAVPAPAFGPIIEEEGDEIRKDRFADAGNEAFLDINQLMKSPTEARRQSQGIPRSFISTFCLNKVFAANYNDVDFAQALTAIDYLRDMECTRRSALREAAQRLGIEKDNWRDVLAHDFMAKKWVENVQAQELAIEGFYANLFMNLRIWVMVNDLQSEPFYKPNALAMLNTLFPPSIQELPNDRVSAKALRKYRSTFYRYISSVESNGTYVLDSLIVNLQQPGAKHSWLTTRFDLEEYLKLANIMVDEALLIDGIDDFRQRSFISHSRETSRTSSALSGRPTTGSSANSSFDGMHSMPPTPKTPNLVSDSSSVRARIFGRRKLSAPSDAQDFFDPPFMPTPLQTPNHSDVSLPISTERAESLVSNTPLLAQDETQISPVYSNEFATSERYENRSNSLSLTGSNQSSSSGLKPAYVEHRRSTSLGMPARLEEFRSPSLTTSEAPSSDSSGTAVPPTPNLPAGDLEFLARPYDQMQAGAPPSLKKKVSAPSFFLKKKASAAKLVARAESRDGTSWFPTSGYSNLASQSTERFSRGSTAGDSLAPSDQERPRLKKKASWSDAKSAAGFRGRIESAASALTQQSNDSAGKKRRKGINLFAKRNGPTPAPLDLKDSPFADPSYEYDGFTQPFTGAKSIRKMRSSPALNPGSPTRLRKASSSSKLRKDPRVFTSSDIKEPFPAELRNRDSRQNSIIYADRNDKLGLKMSDGRAITKDDLDIRKREAASKGDFRPSEFENPRSVPVPRGKTIGDGNFVFPAMTPTILEIDERLKQNQRRQRAGTLTRVDEGDKSRHVANI